MKNNYIYFVEGKCEATLLTALKEQPQKIVSGKVKVFNVIANLIPRSQLLTIQTGTTIIFVFDTDVPVTEQLRKNIELVSTYCSKTKIIFLPQVKNLEDELVRCTDVSNVVDDAQQEQQGFQERFLCSDELQRCIEPPPIRCLAAMDAKSSRSFQFCSQKQQHN